jgi:hypothetical protein
MKKGLFVLLACLSANAIYAQHDAKVVVYREDSHRVQPFHREGVFLNGKRIHKMRNHEVFVYNAKNESGAYCMRPTLGRKVSIEPAPNSVSFVEVGLHEENMVLNRSSAKSKTLREFKQEYYTKKWLRKNLRKAGYDTVEDLLASTK